MKGCNAKKKVRRECARTAARCALKKPTGTEYRQKESTQHLFANRRYLLDESHQETFNGIKKASCSDSRVMIARNNRIPKA